LSENTKYHFFGWKTYPTLLFSKFPRKNGGIFVTGWQPIHLQSILKKHYANWHWTLTRYLLGSVS